MGALGGVTTKDSALVVAPPEFATTTLDTPAVVSSPAFTCAVTCVGLTSVVGRLVPPQTTEDPPTKFVPVTESVNVAPPAVAPVGVIPVSVGPFTVNVTAFEVPDGFCMVTT